MFEDLLRQLERIDGLKISVSISTDKDGYLDRECPSSGCMFEFKIHEDDWRDKVRDEEVFCAFCGHTAESDKWLTQEQVKNIEEAALGRVRQDIGRAMKRDAENWNRQQPRNNFIRMTMKVNSRPEPILLPPQAGDPMRLKITCPACGCRYAGIGAAFFCPACGHNAAEVVFSQAMAGIRSALDSVASVRSEIADRDAAETIIRLIIEYGLQNVVTAFQRYAEALYARHLSGFKARRNAFQNLAEGSDLWQAAFGKKYNDHLNATEMADLTRMFQQRHLLAHTQGLIDQDYVTRSGDTTYRVGQRLVVRETAVRECLGLIEKLAREMANDVGFPRRIRSHDPAIKIRGPSKELRFCARVS
jgi:uncharacterized Zn finger protein (UPF0148 family)